MEGPFTSIEIELLHAIVEGGSTLQMLTHRTNQYFPNDDFGTAQRAVERILTDLLGRGYVTLFVERWYLANAKNPEPHAERGVTPAALKEVVSRVGEIDEQSVSRDVLLGAATGILENRIKALEAENKELKERIVRVESVAHYTRGN